MKERAERDLIIGVSAEFMLPDPQRNLFRTKQLCLLEKDMANYLSSDRTLAWMLPDVEGSQLKRYLQRIDGLVLHGGSDVDPTSYGEKHINPERWPGNKARDLYELRLIEMALKMQIPILGICRGLQILNVFFGGSLYQDLLTQEATTIEHRHADLYDRLQHPVAFTAGRTLEKIYGQTSVMSVNSVHHQGIKKLAPGLQVEAYCPQDKMVEAISFKGSGELKASGEQENWVWGVQWHPEFRTLGPEILDPMPLLDFFIQQCGQRSPHAG